MSHAHLFAQLDTIPHVAALSGLAVLLDLYAALLDAKTDDAFDDADAAIAYHRAHLIPLLDVARGQDLGGPLRDAAVELRRHAEKAADHAVA